MDLTQTLDKLFAAPIATSAVIQEAANGLLIDTGLKAGRMVAVLEDPVYGYNGCKGKIVKNPSAKGGGFADVEMENGNVVPLQSTLLAAL